MIFKEVSIKTIKRPEDVFKVFVALLKMEDEIDQDKEHFYVMHLNQRNKINFVECVSIGTLASTLVHPREVFTRAVSQRSSGIILGHNHPSGEVEPSEEDLEITKKIVEAGKILSIRVLDYVVFDENKYFSFKDKNMIEEAKET